MDNFGAVLGGASSALAIFAGLVGAWRWGRAWRQRRRLRQTVELAKAASCELQRTVVEIDHRMSEGVGWAGWAIWPDALGPHIAYLDKLILDTEAAAARVRGRDVEPRLERLRADVEECLLLLHRGAEIYRSGTITKRNTSLYAPGKRSTDWRTMCRRRDGVIDVIHGRDALRCAV